jgi:hypothetical protein
MRPVLQAGLLTFAAAFAVTAQQARATQPGAHPGDEEKQIALAPSAAPGAVAAHAAVVRMDEKGATVVLRAGDNGWTCMPTDPGTPVSHPVCLDKNGLNWFVAAMAGKEPDPTKVAYSHMLQGGSVSSVVDPAADRLPAGEKSFVTFPPHIVIMNARLAMESGFPARSAHPDTHQPFVLYGGTPYAMLIIPVR